MRSEPRLRGPADPESVVRGRVERHELLVDGPNISSTRQGGSGWNYGAVVTGSTQGNEVFYVGAAIGVAGVACTDTSSSWNCTGQSSPFGIGSDEAGDQYGAALAVGDFNGDGYEDLAVGMPGRTAAHSPTVSSRAS